VSTGIGAGILLRGELYAGAHGIAGEVGHIVVQRDGPLCTCGNRGCLAAAGTTRGARNVPRIVGAAVEKIVGLPCHEQLGRVGSAQDDRARVSEARNQGRILSGYETCSKLGAGFAAHAFHIQRALDADGDSVKGAHPFTAGQCMLGHAGFTARAFGIHLHEGVELGIQFLNPGEMGFHQFDWRQLLAANLLGHGNG